MKMLSLYYLAQNARQSFLRFPFTIISSFVAVATGIYLVEFHDRTDNLFPYINIVLCAALGIPLFFCVNVFSDNKNYPRYKTLLFDLLALGILATVYFTLPNAEAAQNSSIPYIRYALYAITVHLLVAIIPYLHTREFNGFWHYNRILFVRFLSSLLYSGFLYGGLALALGSLDFLFDIDLHEELFFDLFIFMGIFNTWFFVSGIPTCFHSLESITEYPRGIKIFSQFVLLPLLILYLIILYVYASKMVLWWSWPKGIVSYLVVCVAVLGVLTLLLIHPYGSLPGNAWIKKFSRAYYFILLPLVILMFMAIGMRITAYGITINRYIILLLGVWLTVVCFYFAIGKANIKFIPTSLAVILMFVSFGYWGIFSVSERSQVARLKAILEQTRILEDGKIQREVIWRRDSLPALYPITATKENTNEHVVADSLHNEILSILNYLDDHHGFSGMRGWYQQNLDSIINIDRSKTSRWSTANASEIYMRSMGLEYGYKYKPASYQNLQYSFSSEKSDLIDIRGYDYMINFHIAGYMKKPFSFRIDDSPYSVHYSLAGGKKLLLTSEKADTIVFDIAPMLDKLMATHGVGYHTGILPSRMLLHGRNDAMDTKVELLDLTYIGGDEFREMNSISGNIFIRRKSSFK